MNNYQLTRTAAAIIFLACQSGKDAWAGERVQRFVKDDGSTVRTGEPFLLLWSTNRQRSLF
jgi:hypothetical protein